MSPRARSARGRVTVIRYIPTRRDVTGLYPAGYYGLRHTAARLLWSLIGNRFCVILAHWYSVHRLSFFGEWLRSVCLATCTYVYAESSWNGKKVVSCLRVSRKRFGSIAPVGWSDSDSNFEGNDAKAINTKNRKRLSLSFVSDSKRFKRLKQKISRGLRSQIFPVNMKRNTNWAVKAFQTWWRWHNSTTAEEEYEMCQEDARTTMDIIDSPSSNINFNWTQHSHR